MWERDPCRWIDKVITNGQAVVVMVLREPQQSLQYLLIAVKLIDYRKQ